MKNSERIKIWEELSVNFSLIPLKGKVPIEKGWQKYCEEKRSFDAALFEGRNAGIATGPGSNLLVVDVDNPIKFESHCKKMGWIIPKTYKVLTTSGYHLYFQYPKDGSKYGNKALKNLVSMLEV